MILTANYHHSSLTTQTWSVTFQILECMKSEQNYVNDANLE